MGESAGYPRLAFAMRSLALLKMTARETPTVRLARYAAWLSQPRPMTPHEPDASD
jgi:hypothetical protein